MLRGFVDTISHERAIGWAADTSRPNDPVELSIVIDGYEQLRLCAERPREDLKKLHVYGDGQHGFNCEFNPPLSRDRAHEILVRFSSTKEILERGRVVITNSAVESSDGLPLRKPANVREVGEAPLLPAPETVRRLLEVLQAFDVRRKLGSIASQLDFTAVGLRQMYRAILDRLPTLAELQTERTDQQAEQRFCEILASREFQERVITLMLAALPEKRRLIFIHVPKCAGTDLTESLAPHYAHLYYHMSLEHFTTKEHLFEELKAFSLRARLSDTVLVTGHVPLRWYLDENLIRCGDRVFTTIREPRELAVSNANFVATRLIKFRHTPRPDTTGWLKALDIETIPNEPDENYILELAQKVLYCPALMGNNIICDYLGRGTAESALQQLAVADVEITDTSRYGRWRKRTWGLDDATRVNESLKILNDATLTDDDMSYVRGLTFEDRKLYDIITRKLNDTGRLSIRASELDIY